MLILLVTGSGDDPSPPSPPQPASTGSAVDSTTDIGTTNAKIHNNDAILNSLLFMSFVLLLV